MPKPESDDEEQVSFYEDDSKQGRAFLVEQNERFKLAVRSLIQAAGGEKKSLGDTAETRLPDV